jgi:hypothetical protein
LRRRAARKGSSRWIRLGLETTKEQVLQLIDIGQAMAQKYDVVVTNPPYMGNMPSKITEYARRFYYDYRYDSYALFIKQCSFMKKATGFFALVTGDSWLTLSSFANMRKEVINYFSCINMIPLGTNAFEAGFGTVAFVFTRKIDHYCTKYIDLSCKTFFDKNFFVENREIYYHDNDVFLELNDAQILVPSSDKDIIILKSKEKDSELIPKAGIVAGNNDLYLRMWFEINIQTICFSAKVYDTSDNYHWIPLHKGGGFRKWYGIHEYVIRLSRMLSDRSENKSIRTGDSNYYFLEGITWSTLSNKFGARKSPAGFVYNTKGSMCFAKDPDHVDYLLALLNSKVSNHLIEIISPNLDYNSGTVAKLPCIISNKDCVQAISVENIKISKKDWDSFETSWDFHVHPLVSGETAIKEAYARWQSECNDRFTTLKSNEEKLNRIFIDIYGLQDELIPEEDDKDVTVRKADLGRDIRSLLSYAVGCMFGRYSLDVPGLAYAGGTWDDSKYTTFIPDKDNILPITDEEYFEDDIVGLLIAWLKKVYGEKTLEENLDFIAGALGNKGSTSREVIRNYFVNDFFADHCKVYQKRPIYWLFDSGRKNGFKALVYLHRYDENTIGNLRIDYLHRMERVYESGIARMQDVVDNSAAAREVTAAAKRKEKLVKQLKECRDYDEKIAHLALARISLDLDDGVKANYRKLQTGTDGKFYEVLADSKDIMAKE